MARAWSFGGRIGRTRRQRLHEEDADLLARYAVLPAQLGPPLDELADDLDAGEPGARHDKGQQRPALVGVRLLGSAVIDLLDVVAQPHRVFHRPQGKGMLRDPGKVKGLGLAARGEHEVVVGVLVLGGAGDPRGEVDLFDAVENDFDLAVREEAFKRDPHRVGLDAASGHLVQLGHEGVIGLLVDESDPQIVLLAALLQLVGGFDAGVASADDQHSLGFGHSRPPCCCCGKTPGARYRTSAFTAARFCDGQNDFIAIPGTSIYGSPPEAVKYS